MKTLTDIKNEKYISVLLKLMHFPSTVGDNGVSGGCHLFRAVKPLMRDVTAHVYAAFILTFTNTIMFFLHFTKILPS